MDRARQSRLRIAVVGLRGFPCDYSGIERVSEALYAGLVDRGHTVTVFARDPFAHTPPSIHRGVRVFYVRGINWAPLDTLSQAVLTFGAAGKRNAYDVVHLHALASSLLAPAYRFRAIPIAVTIHGLDWRRARWRGVGGAVLRGGELCAVRFAHEIIVVSHDLARYFRERYDRETTVVHNALPWPPHNMDKSHEHPVGSFPVVLYAGRLVPEKRIEDLVVAFGSVASEGQLVIAGTGPARYVNALKRYARDDPRVVFVGHLSRANVFAMMRSAAVVVNPSELEGFPLAIVESAGHGVPVILSDIASHRELIAATGAYAKFFKLGDRTRLSALLCELLPAAQSLRTPVSTAHARLRERLPVERMIDETEAALWRASTRSAS